MNVMKLVALLTAAVTADPGVTSFLRNELVDASFDSRGTLVALSDLSRVPPYTHKLSGDGWKVELGDLPVPTGATVFTNQQVLVNATCPTLPSPPPLTTIDQCAFQCMATDRCLAWTASFATWVTWGRPRLDCRLHTCAGPFGHTVDSANTSAGIKPVSRSVQLTAASCTEIEVTHLAGSVLQALHVGCGGFRVNVTYELSVSWHFVTKHLSICRESGNSCDPAAGFTVRRVSVWPGLRLHPDTALGAMGLNPYSRRDEFGETYQPGSGETASFWRTTSGAGLFASIQNSFFESGEGFSAFRWGAGNDRWGNVNSGAWKLGAAITDTRNLQPAALEGTVNIQGQSANGGNDLALALKATASLHQPVFVGVTMVEGQATNKPVPTPLAGGYAGVLFGATATAATANAAAMVEGFAAVVCLADGKQIARLLKLSGFVKDAHTSQVIQSVPLNVSSTSPIRLALSAHPRLVGLTNLSINGNIVLQADLSSQIQIAKAQSGVGLIVLQQDASFVHFSSSAVASAQSPLEHSPPEVQGSYSPMMKQVPSLGSWHTADAGVLGVTSLTGHELSESGIDLKELQAFTSCIEHFLLDKEMRESGAVRYQVAWDSNEYQLDMSNEEDREQYKRLIRRNAELGIDHMVYEPRNTAVSSRWEHTDAWWWEEVLWFQLGIGIRNGSWAPARNALPPTVAEMLDFFKEQGVAPAAYAYPTLAWRGKGEEEWLYEAPERIADPTGKKASLASPKLQDYLIQTMNAFLDVTGGAGFAWDYGIQGDTRVANMYQEVRGWTRILTALRKANPDMVMDHRQIAHRFGPWYHLAGSYSEPIAGDENPESYGAALASLSTDHILADNLRLTNYRYRLQMLPNDRVPGFIGHQTERHFNNGTGDDSLGRPGDKIDSDGDPLWKPDPIPDPHTGNYSGITYGNCVVQQSWHTRDFDYLGYRYSLISTLGTAGRNLVVANIPARDMEEYTAFPQEDIAWIRKWFDWADTHGQTLIRTIPLLGYEYPRLGRVDGTVAVHNNSGFVFLYNPSPDPASAVLHFGEVLGLDGASGHRWLVSEIYPREDGMPIGIWGWRAAATFEVAGGSARILKLSRWMGSTLKMPIAFNISYKSIQMDESAVAIEGGSGLSGSTANVVVRLPADKPASAIMVNGHRLKASRFHCFDENDYCISTKVTFGGSPSLRNNPRAAAAPTQQSGMYEAQVIVTSAMIEQLQERQNKYNISWVQQDLDASWLAPNRLLLYIYVARPSPSLVAPSVLIDNEPVRVVQQYNSRGNHAIVPAGGGAVSGNTARTFLGWYVDCSSLLHDVPHNVSIGFQWSQMERDAHSFSGIYWHNIQDELSQELKH